MADYASLKITKVNGSPISEKTINLIISYDGMRSHDIKDDKTEIRISARICECFNRFVDEIAKTEEGLLLEFSTECSYYDVTELYVSQVNKDQIIEWFKVYEYNSHSTELQLLYNHAKKSDKNEDEIVEELRRIISEILGMKEYDLSELDILERKEKEAKKKLAEIIEEKNNLKKGIKKEHGIDLF